MTYEAGKRQSRTQVKDLKKELEAERKKIAELQLELQNATKRLHQCTRMSVLRRNKIMARRQIKSHEEDEESSSSYVPTTDDEDFSEDSGVTRVTTTVTNDFSIFINDYGC